MADESLHDPDGDWGDLLVTAAYDYVVEHGIPDSREALAWLAEPNFERVLEGYFAGAGGFSISAWESMITNIEHVRIRENGAGGIYINFDFDFESEDGDYVGARGAYASF